MGYIDSYYADTLTDDVSFPTCENDIKTETCIIGGGLAGLNTALELVEAGHDTVLIEAHKIAWGASGRNAGFVLPGYALGTKALAKKLGNDHALSLYNLTVEAIEKIKTRMVDFDIDCGAVPSGSLKLSLAFEKGDLKSDFTFAKNILGQDVEYWDLPRIQESLSTTAYNAAILNKDAMQFHPLNYARGVAKGAAKAGAKIFEHSPAAKVEDLGAIKRVVLENGAVIEAKNIVYACSGYIDGLSRRLTNAVVPVATYIMVTEPLGDRLQDAIRVPYTLGDTRFAGDYYRPLQDTRILWGGRVSAFEVSPDKVAQLLHKDMCKIYPQLSDVKIDSSWSGYMGYAQHKMPQILKMSEGVWCCTAFGGYGMSATTAGGAVMADAILGLNQNIDLFKSFGLRFTGGPLLAPAVAQTMYWGYQMADAFKRFRIAA